MKYIIEYPQNKDQVKIAKNIYEIIKDHDLYLERRARHLNCIPETVLLEERQEESEMTKKILAEIEKILRVKKLLTDQELAPSVKLKTKRALDEEIRP
jgi:oligoribonuclease NrnB/cAMP/cGMP phosphodiesterase (DHH superfamily)